MLKFRIKIYNSDKIISEIESYRELPEGWNFGTGFPPSDEIIKKAIEIYRIGQYYGFKTEPTPLTSGGINLTFYITDLFLDLYINSDNTIDLKIEKGIGREYEIIDQKRHISQNEIEEIILQTKLQCDNSLGQSRLKNTRKAKVDSMIETYLPTTMGGFQYFPYSV